jgi:DNA primase small subunit
MLRNCIPDALCASRRLNVGLNNPTKSFLRSVYKEYYFRKGESIEFPDELGSREFGYIPFGGGMVRHLSFKTQGEALAEIVRQSPSSVYCSNARYQAPMLPIEEKGWLGAELIFDIDATDIPTQCKKGHDIWYCRKCHSTGKLPRPRSCPKCGGEADEHHGTCDLCLGAAKQHAMRTAAILAEDFGVDGGRVRVYFSGNRGYHLHVYDERFDLLDQGARGEIAGYVRGDALPAAQTLAAEIRKGRFRGGPGSEGWARRITRFVAARQEGYSGTVQKLVFEAIAEERSLVDSSVTTDVHRVFRLAGTLHGTTGMAKTRVRDLEAFDPRIGPVVLTERPVDVRVAFYPKFEVKGERFGPFQDESVELPTFAAVQILTRGLGEVA